MVKTRRQRKSVICDCFGMSSDDLELYQPSRMKNVWTDGDGYFTATRGNEEKSTLVVWEKCSLWRDDDVKAGWTVWRSV